jgi:N-succinyldiaminopimelate aminotransferase
VSHDTPLVPRLRPLGTTIFAEMSALAAATGAVNLGQGYPDLDGPRGVAEAATQAILEGWGNQYPPGPGIPELRLAVAGHQRAAYGIDLDPETEVLVTTGATEALTAAILALVDAGDEVVALEPWFDSYPAAVAMARGVLRGVRLSPPDFRLDESALRAAVTERTRVLLLNSPHNPTGMVLTQEELAAVARVVADHPRLVVVTDEVYEHLTFDVAHVPFATVPGMRERTLSVSSSGKTFSFTGWKIGWATGPAPLVSAVRTVKQYLTYVSGGPFQYAVAHALAHEMPWVAGLRQSLKDRRDRLCLGLAAVGLEPGRPDGTYFVTTDVTAVGWGDDRDFCRAMVDRAGVVAIPCSVFYDPADPVRTLVRWTFTKQDHVLDEAVARLAAAAPLSP